MSTRACEERTPRSPRPARSRAGTIRRAAACAFTLAWGAGAGAAAADPSGPEPGDGLRWEPSVSWTSGDHRIDLGADTRFRNEWWDAHATTTSTFQAVRTRVRLRYSFKELASVFGEFQDTRIWGLSGSSSGAAALYRRFTDDRTGNDADGQSLRQIYAEIEPREGFTVTGGRKDIKLGTEHMYKEASWRYLKVARASQRLVGTVGWTHGERSNDGGSLAYETDGYHVFGFGALPTTGVFQLDDGYHTQDEIVYGGLSVTAKRDTWLPDTEVRPFFLYYTDDRSPSHGGLPGGVDIATFGFSAIGVYDVGPGLMDLFVWGAGQGGEYNNVDHWAGAGIVEAGYQLPEVPAKPWLRVGLNIASGGDGGAVGGGATGTGSGDHNTFFNVLPTNHLYYGFADRFAFMNLIDLIGQLKLELHPKASLNLMVHQFWLTDKKDSQYFGTGAFSRKGSRAGAFGYGGVARNGNSDVGTELDTVVDVKLTRFLSVQAGFSYLWGGDFLQAAFADEDVEFGYLQVAARY